MRLCLINPCNPLVSMSQPSRWRRYRVWKPLGLMTIAALTPAEWEVTIIDENLGVPDYSRMPRPDLVGITAFTSQAPRAYEIAAVFRRFGVPVVMGGIHASMCTAEALAVVDAVVKGEAEAIWPTVLADAQRGALRQLYEGRLVDLESVPPARHDLLSQGYAFGSIQTTRGCPLNCHFCSVSAFNGQGYRHRPVEAVVREFGLIRERLVLIVDDNLIGTRREHLARAKDLFRAMIAAKLGKKWICQTTINFGDDEELLELAARSGCVGAFIGFESLSDEGLAELGKQYNILKGGDLRASVARIHRHGILVVGSFIMGLDSDTPGVGKRIAKAAGRYAIDLLNPIFLTPLPGTRLWEKMHHQGRITANLFPRDWRYYTLSFPVARFQNFSWSQMLAEMDESWRRFYSPWRILRRVLGNLRRWRSPLTMLVASLSYRRNYSADRKKLKDLDLSRGEAWSALDPVAADCGVEKLLSSASALPS
ncbi:MAG: radical SAM protein [Tepidisphaeraceae bacterium]